MYLDSQQPRMLPRDENGFVADIHDPTSSCFNEAGDPNVGVYPVSKSLDAVRCSGTLSIHPESSEGPACWKAAGDSHWT